MPRIFYMNADPNHKADTHSYTYTMKATNEKNNKDAAGTVFSVLPERIVSAVMRALESSAAAPEDVTEIRLRRAGRSYITSAGRHIPIAGGLGGQAFDDMFFELIGGSLYAHAETIREGYISVGGIRCGVSGRAVMKNGGVCEVADISSVTVRIPRDFPGCSERVFELIDGEVLSGALIYSPPGGGKTTLLRDLIGKLSAADRQFAVIDARRELGAACAGGSADVLTDYPKSSGIVCAVRSLCPEIIICDELSGDDDSDAALYAYSCGVPIVATAHAKTLAGLRARGGLRTLIDSGVFPHIVGIDHGFRLNIHS